MLNKLRQRLKVKAEQKVVKVVVNHIQKQAGMKNASYKTTIVGVLGAVFIAALPVIQTGSFDFKKDWPNLVAAAGSAALGYFSKDADKTGLPK